MAFKIASTHILVFLISSLIIVHSSNSIPSPINFLKDLNGTRKEDRAIGLIELKKYLAYLGFINPTNDTLESALKEYQNFYNLKVTGFLDQETVDLMSRPRCGVPDRHFFQNPNMNRSLYRIVTAWPRYKRNLTFSYSIDTRADAKPEIVTALLRWFRISPFIFRYYGDYEGGDINIGFKRRDHGDEYPFDGYGGILAHAYFPPDGRLHFDADEIWGTEVRKGTLDIQSVALHEIGHILGLGHSKIPAAVMYPYLDYGQPRKPFTLDDIDAISALYPND